MPIKNEDSLTTALLTNPTSSFGKVDFELPYNVEDEAAIVSLSLYKESKTKQIVYTILCFLTIGMTALFARWKVDTKIKLRYQLCQISDASHIFIHGKGLLIRLLNKKLISE